MARIKNISENSRSIINTAIGTASGVFIGNGLLSLTKSMIGGGGSSMSVKPIEHTHKLHPETEQMLKELTAIIGGAGLTPPIDGIDIDGITHGDCLNS